MKKIKSIIIIILACMALTGCEYRHHSIEGDITYIDYYKIGSGLVIKSDSGTIADIDDIDYHYMTNDELVELASSKIGDHVSVEFVSNGFNNRLCGFKKMS